MKNLPPGASVMTVWAGDEKVFDIHEIGRDVANIICAHQREVSDITGGLLDETTTLEAMGMDSLDRTEIAITIEDKFKIEFRDDWFGWETVGDVIRSTAAAVLARA